MRVTIKADTVQMERKLQTLVNKQLAFAAAVAATKTAVEVRDNYVLPAYRKAFEARNKPFEKVVHNVAAADARSAKATKVAVAAIKRKDAAHIPGTTKRQERSGRGPASTEFMRRHVRGGVKTPRSRSKIAIPITGSAVSRRMAGAKAGAVSKTFQPKTIMQSGRGFIMGKKGSGKSYIARRMARGKVQVLYALASSANIPAVYDPMPKARRGVAARFPVQFRRAFLAALKTSSLR
jgi:transcriptional regulator with AAA-type ATPase domain